MSSSSAPQKRRFEHLLADIDGSIQAHLAWNQRLMRCALLHETPDDDMLQPDAHQRCGFGRWLLRERTTLAGFDAARTEALDRHHREMHDAVRALCSACLAGQPARGADLARYEAGQTGMMQCLSALRTQVAESVLQHDVLTGLPLRNGLPYAFRIRQRDVARGGQPLYLAMVDVDHFKTVNDSWGHAVGDQVLQHLARIMVGCLRENDIVIRYGGEEFLFLLIGPGGEAVVQRLLHEVRRHPARIEGGRAVPLSVTAGLTTVTAQDTLDAAIDRADHALLEGKRQGRDRYVVAPVPPA